MMPEAYKYICGCGHWWATENGDRRCPQCGGDELVSRVFLESEEAAILAALGSLTFERDEARRWARYYKRLFEALAPAPAPFVATTDGESITRQSNGRKAKGAK